MATATAKQTIESVTLTLSEDEAEALLALLMRTSTTGAFDPLEMYTVLLDALGYSESGKNSPYKNSRYRLVLSGNDAVYGPFIRLDKKGA